MNEEHSCIICLESVETLEKNMYCKCNFYFHPVCLRSWRLEKNHCLMCRISYDPLPNYMIIYKVCTFRSMYNMSERTCKLVVQLFFIYLLYSFTSEVVFHIFFYNNVSFY